MQISAIMPAFEEAGSLRAVVTELTRALEAAVGHDWELLVVVSLGARDGTVDLASRLASEDRRIRLVEQASDDFGYGRAVSLGIESAQGEWLLLIDADGQLDPAELSGFVATRGAADAIVGYRASRRDGWARRAASGIYAAVVRSSLGVRGVRDIDCAFKLIRTSRLRGARFTSRTGVVNAEILAHMLARGARIVELPVTHRARTLGKSRFEQRFFGLGTVPRPSEAIRMAREVAALAARRIVPGSSRS